MDDQSRMMHSTGQVGMMPQPYGMQPVDPNHGTATSPDQETRKQDIGEILQQIINITDQSLDEAQARFVFFLSIHRTHSSAKDIALSRKSIISRFFKKSQLPNLLKFSLRPTGM